jgi:hypothetical protein
MVSSTRMRKFRVARQAAWNIGVWAAMEWRMELSCKDECE